jgi:Putative lumazine-binding
MILGMNPSVGGRALIPILVALLSLGCAGPVASLGERVSGNEPQAVVRQYLEAMYAGRARDAWNMHSTATNEGESFELFEEVVRAAAASAGGSTIESMSEPQVSGDRATVRVTQRLGGRASTTAFELAREDGRWRIHNPAR